MQLSRCWSGQSFLFFNNVNNILVLFKFVDLKTVPVLFNHYNETKTFLVCAVRWKR